MIASSPKLSISKEIPSRPGAFPELNSEMAVMISSSERGADKSVSDREEDVLDKDETTGRSSMERQQC